MKIYHRILQKPHANYKTMSKIPAESQNDSYIRSCSHKVPTVYTLCEKVMLVTLLN